MLAMITSSTLVIEYLNSLLQVFTMLINMNLWTITMNTWDPSGIGMDNVVRALKMKRLSGVTVEERGPLTREQSNSERKCDSKLHNAVKRGLSRTSDRNLHSSWDKYIHRSIWIGKLFNDYALNLVGTNLSQNNELVRTRVCEQTSWLYSSLLLSSSFISRQTTPT